MPALAAPRHAAQQRDDRKGAVQAGAEIRHRHAALHRRAVGLAGHAHDAAHRLHRDVEAALARARSRLAEGRDRAIDELGLLGPERLPAKTQAIHDAGTVVLDHDVGGQDQPARRRLVRGVLEVEHDRALVAVERGEVLAEARADRRPLAQHVALGRLDLDDLGAHVGQQQAAERSRRDLAEFDDLHACKRQHRLLLPQRRASWRRILPGHSRIGRSAVSNTASSTSAVATMMRSSGSRCRSSRSQPASQSPSTAGISRTPSDRRRTRQSRTRRRPCNPAALQQTANLVEDDARNRELTGGERGVARRFLLLFRGLGRSSVIHRIVCVSSRRVIELPGVVPPFAILVVVVIDRSDDVAEDLEGALRRADEESWASRARRRSAPSPCRAW